jgi:hypothetical protein
MYNKNPWVCVISFFFFAIPSRNILTSFLTFFGYTVGDRVATKLWVFFHCMSRKIWRTLFRVNSRSFYQEIILFHGIREINLIKKLWWNERHNVARIPKTVCKGFHFTQWISQSLAKESFRNANFAIRNFMTIKLFNDAAKLIAGWHMQDGRQVERVTLRILPCFFLRFRFLCHLPPRCFTALNGRYLNLLGLYCVCGDQRNDPGLQ